MKKSMWWFAAPAACFAILYHQVIAKLVYDWYTDDNYSHGFFIAPIALYFVWERRAALKDAARCGNAWGLVLVAGALAMLLAGVLGSELFLTRFSMLGVLAGAVLFLFGWRHLKIAILPIAFLLLMIPIPAIIFNHIVFPLQLLASQFGEGALVACHIPVLREGNVIHLATTSLEVAEACSGIRSLISLLTLGIVYGYLMDPRVWVRVVLAAGTVPIAIVANGIRVAGTGIAAHYYGAAAAEGFAHTFSGWLIFVAAFIMMFILYRVIVLVAPRRAAVAEAGPPDGEPDAESALAEAGRPGANEGEG
ncbi:MAG: exosortase/archaeosortase family protein [Acidobacteriota bacterium]|nr:exosortase/archaeosortase family protein [Acidobacteriota bacterium]